jgi:hypothetical protein
MFKDFIPHQHPHLYQTGEYHIWVHVLAGQASDRSLSYLFQQARSDSYMSLVVEAEVNRRRALEA